MPGAAVAATTYTYTATDADGETASLTFTIAIAGAAPSFGSATRPAMSDFLCSRSPRRYAYCP